MSRPGDGNGIRPLSEHGWVRGGPLWLRVAIWVLGVSGSPAMRPLFRLARKKKDRVPKMAEPASIVVSRDDDSVIDLTSDPVG